MKLYYSETLNPRKACALAKHLGLPVEFIKVDLGQGEHKSPAFLAMNPNGRVPVLEDGGRTIWESNAILCHLAVAAGSGLWPKEPAAQVEVTRWFSWDSAHFKPHGGALYFEHVIKPWIGLGGPDETAVKQATQHFKASAAVLDAHLADRRFALGDELSVADFALASALPWAKEAKLPLDEFAAIRRWHARLMELPAWREPY